MVLVILLLPTIEQGNLAEVYTSRVLMITVVNLVLYTETNTPKGHVSISVAIMFLLDEVIIYLHHLLPRVIYTALEHIRLFTTA